MLDLTIGMRLLIFVIGLGLGFFLLLKTLVARNLIGELPWAEQHMGAGGTYTLLKLWGIFFIIIAIIILIRG
jgi:hypothetical protein